MDLHEAPLLPSRARIGRKQQSENRCCLHLQKRRLLADQFVRCARSFVRCARRRFQAIDAQRLPCYGRSSSCGSAHGPSIVPIVAGERCWKRSETQGGASEGVPAEQREHGEWLPEVQFTSNTP